MACFVGLVRGEILPSRCNQPAAGHLRRLRDRGGDRHQLRDRAPALFQARSRGRGGGDLGVHALGSALGLGPKARMGEKPCGIVQAGDRHNSADLRRASRFGHFDDLDPAARSQTRHVGVHQ
jgi:hypothetical protein